MTIAELAPGQSGVIAAYRGADAEERHLLDMGLTPSRGCISMWATGRA